MKFLILALALASCDTNCDIADRYDCGVCLPDPDGVPIRLHCDEMSSGYCLIKPDLGLVPGLYVCVPEQWAPDGICPFVSSPAYPWAMRLP